MENIPMNQLEKQKKKLGARDIITTAAMLVICLVIYAITGALTLPVPFLYLYCCAGIQGFLCAPFFLVAANRIGKHGLMFFWAALMGVIQGLSGYMFLLPYFLLLGGICELVMIGRNTYRKPVRTGIGWVVYCLGMIIGNAVPLWVAWESYTQTAAMDGFSNELFEMQMALVHDPAQMLLACAITCGLAFLGILFGQRLLRRHFKKAGVVG